MNSTPVQDSIKIPDFSITDIVQYFTDLQIQISSEDIKKPNTNILITLYETILEIYPNIKVIDHLDNNSTDAHFYLLMYNFLNNVMFKRLGVYNFSFKDLIQPQANKTISFLSAIVNFSMYRDIKKNVYLEVLESMNEKDKYFSDIDERISEAVLQVEILENKKVKEEEEIKKLEFELRNKEEILKENMKIYREKVNFMEDVEKTYNDLEDESSSNQVIRVNLEREYKLLSTQIISDPDRLLNAIKEMEKMLYNEKEYYTILESKILAYKKENDFLEEKIKEVQQVLKLAGEYKKNSAEKNSQFNYRNSLCSKMNLCENDISRMQKIMKVTTRKTELLKTKLSTIIDKNEEINRIAKEEKEKLSRAREEHYKNLYNETNSKDELTRILNGLNQEIIQLNEFFDEQFRTVKKYMRDLGENALIYFENLYNSVPQ